MSLFQEYKLHLTSELHKSQMNKLARKQTMVLRNIRLQQRQEQKEIEDKWREAKPEEFKTSVSRCDAVQEKLCVLDDVENLCSKSNCIFSLNLTSMYISVWTLPCKQAVLSSCNFDSSRPLLERKLNML